MVRFSKPQSQSAVSTLRNIQRATLWMMLGRVLINILSFVKSLVIAAYYGTSAQLDAYVLSLAPLRLIAGVLVGAIQAVLIPRYLELRCKHDEAHAASVLGTFLLCIAGVLILISGMLWIGSSFVAASLGSGFDEELVDFTTSLLKISGILLFFSICNDIGIMLFQAHRQFLFTAFIPLVSGIGSLVYMIVFRMQGVPSLLYGLLLGMVIQCGVVFFRARRFFSTHSKQLSPFHPEIRRLFTAMMPLLLGATFGHINVVVDQMMASTLPAGSIAALNYANKLHTMLTQMFIMVISTVMLPFLSQQAARQDLKTLKDTFLLASRRIVYILIPISLGIMLIGRDLVQFAFERGQFTVESTVATTGAWIAYTIGLPIQAVGILTARVYNALQENIPLMYVSGAGIGLNIVLNWVFMKFWGHIGIALSTSGVYLVATGTLLFILHRKFRNLEHAL